MADRGLDATLQAAAESSEFKYVIFVYLDFPSGIVRVHNSLGTITWGGNDWLGIGGYGSIDAMEENIQLVDNPINLTLSAITPEIIDAIKTEDIYDREANIYLGVLNAGDELVGTPYQWVAGYMEHASVVMGENNGVTISIQTDAAKLRRRNNKRYTLEDHQVDHPGDVFFNHLHIVKDAEVPWGGEMIGSRGQGVDYGGNYVQRFKNRQGR